MRTSHTITRTLVAVAAFLALAGAAMAATFTSTVANPDVSDQKAGAVLVFPYYTSASDGNFSKSDTLMQITNVCNGPAVSGGIPQYSYLHLFFLNGSNCSPADTFVCLTPNGSIQIKASDYDPTVTGYLIAIAVDATGMPTTGTTGNCFIGSAFVRDDNNSIIGSYGAEAFAGILGGTVTSNADGSTSVRLDGTNYDAAPTQFSVQVQDPNVAREFIVLASVNGNLGVALSTVGQSGVGVLYRADETPASFQPFTTGNCQVVNKVDKNKPRIVPGDITTFLKNSYGYLKFNTNVGAVGLLLSAQGPANQPNNRWSGIRTLHKTNVGSATLVVPMFPPFCGF
jgi:hypothetical protein